MEREAHRQKAIFLRLQQNASKPKVISTTSTQMCCISTKDKSQLIGFV